jgi:hypothetical protein
MPFTAAELESWVKGLGIPEADQKVVLEKLGAEAVLPKVGEAILMRSDYSKNLDALKQEKEKLESEYRQKVAAEDKFRESLTGWKTQKEKEYEGQLAAARQEAEAKLAAASAKIKAVADRYGVPEDEVKDLLVAAPNPNPNPAPPRDSDTGKFLPREEWNREAQAYVKLPAIMVGLDREYYRLFGNDAPPINWEKVIEGATANKRPVSQEFESMFHMEDKRKEIAKAAHDKEIDDARKAGEQSAMSKLMAEHPELANRSVIREHRGSPILDEARRQAAAGKPPDKPAGGPRSAVEAAVKAFQDGRYKGGVENAA